jgi:hypothetical protein
MGVGSGALEREAVPAPLVSPVVLIELQTQVISHEWVIFKTNIWGILCEKITISRQKNHIF